MLSAQGTIAGACEACHKHKIKCCVMLQETSCQACQRNQRTCIFVRRSTGGRPRKAFFGTNTVAHHQQAQISNQEGACKTQLPTSDLQEHQIIPMSNSTWNHASDKNYDYPQSNFDLQSVDESPGDSAEPPSPTAGNIASNSIFSFEWEGPPRENQAGSSNGSNHSKSLSTTDFESNTPWENSSSPANSFQNMLIGAELWQEQSLESRIIATLLRQCMALQQTHMAGEDLQKLAWQLPRIASGNGNDEFGQLDASCRTIFALYGLESSAPTITMLQNNSCSVPLLALLIVSMALEVCHKILRRSIPDLSSLDRLLRLKQLAVNIVQTRISLIQIGKTCQPLSAVVQEVMKMNFEADVKIRSYDLENFLPQM